MSITTQYVEPMFNPSIVASTNYVYSEWYTLKADYVSVQVGVATLTASSIEYRLEGKPSDTYTRVCEIYNASINNTTDLDVIINVTENVKYIRGALKANNAATPNAVYMALIKSESR